MEQIIKNYEKELTKFYSENSKKKQELTSSWIEISSNKIVKKILEDISNRITWLVEIKEGFKYKNLLDFKREIFEKKKIKKMFDFKKILTKEQKELLDNYKIELYQSAIYWTPLGETQEEKLNLEIWEELYFIEKNIERFLNI
jgi:hypothetical protein